MRIDTIDPAYYTVADGEILDEHHVDEYVEGLCQRFYADDDYIDDGCGET